MHFLTQPIESFPENRTFLAIIDRIKLINLRLVLNVCRSVMISICHFFGLIQIGIWSEIVSECVRIHTHPNLIAAVLQIETIFIHFFSLWQSNFQFRFFLFDKISFHSNDNMCSTYTVLFRASLRSKTMKDTRRMLRKRRKTRFFLQLFNCKVCQFKTFSSTNDWMTSILSFFWNVYCFFDYFIVLDAVAYINTFK